MVTDFERDHHSDDDGFHTLRLANEVVEKQAIKIARAIKKIVSLFFATLAGFASEAGLDRVSYCIVASIFDCFVILQTFQKIINQIGIFIDSRL